MLEELEINTPEEFKHAEAALAEAELLDQKLQAAFVGALNEIGNSIQSHSNELGSIAKQYDDLENEANIYEVEEAALKKIRGELGK